MQLVLEELVNAEDEKDHGKLFDVMMGAHVLGVKELEDLCGLTAEARESVRGEDSRRK